MFGLMLFCPIDKTSNAVNLFYFLLQAVMVKIKVSNVAEPTGKCFDIIVYMFVVIVPLISPQFPLFLDFWVSPKSWPLEILRFAAVMEWGSASPPCHRMGVVAPYIEQSTHIGSADGIW